jgi:hypothetical protein
MGIPVVNFNRGQDDARLTDITSDNIVGRAARGDVPDAGGHTRIAHVMGWQGSHRPGATARGASSGDGAAGLDPPCDDRRHV